MNDAVPRRVRAFLRDRLLQGLLVLAFVLSLWQAPRPAALLQAVDWPTIATLFGLLSLTKGIEQSGALTYAGQFMIARLRRQRVLALFLEAMTAVLSMLLTNDVALFIVVPLTLGLRRDAPSLPIGRLVIFEALAANAGSLATPIGNPQNILLWHSSQLSFADFTLQMAPLSAALLALLLIATVLAFPDAEIDTRAASAAIRPDRRLFFGCATAYAGFLVLLALGHPVWAAAAVFVYVLAAQRAVLLEVDWSLLAVFVLMFIDVHLITRQGAIAPLLAAMAGHSPLQLFIAALAWSQFVSNVPATILLLEYVNASRLVAYAVNVGGFGLAIGSLANLIALRLAREPGLAWRFHGYSLPALLLGAALAWWLL